MQLLGIEFGFNGVTSGWLIASPKVMLPVALARLQSWKLAQTNVLEKGICKVVVQLERNNLLGHLVW